MDSKTKLEKVLELVINEETEQASDLLHDIFVEKSREIYADLIEEDAEVEDVIEEDEDQVEEEDLDETIDVSDSEADFISDIEDATDEIEAEEVFGEDDDDDAEMDLSDEMSDEDDNMEGDAPAVEEKSEFDLHLTAIGDNKVNTIKAVREITGLGLKEAKDIVDAAPKVVKEALAKADADEAMKKLTDAGATAELK